MDLAARTTRPKFCSCLELRGRREQYARRANGKGGSKLQLVGVDEDCSAVDQEADAGGLVGPRVDFALIADGSTLRSEVTFLHFVGGFAPPARSTRSTSWLGDHLAGPLRGSRRARSLGAGADPRPLVLRRSAREPDVFFQTPEGANPFNDSVSRIFSGAIDELAGRTSGNKP
jgi:hypothetical protein